MEADISSFIENDSDDNSENSDNDNDSNNSNSNNNVVLVEDLMNTTTTTKTQNNSEDDDSDNNNNNSNKIVRAEDMMAKMLSKTQEQLSKFPSIAVENNVSLSFDLGNMTVYDGCDINQRLLNFNNNSNNSNSKGQKSSKNEIDLTARKEKEKYLISMSRNNTQAMVNELFKLPVRTDAENEGMSIIVRLPPPRTRLPREKPLPINKDKALTRWEKFAQRKNIRKKQRNPHENKVLEWDESRQEWRKRWGYNKANNEMENVIYEHHENDYSKEDPWTRMKNEKKKRIAINEENRKMNLKNALEANMNGNGNKGNNNAAHVVNLEHAIRHSKLKRKNKLPQQKGGKYGVTGGRRAERQSKKFNFSKYGNLNKTLEIAQHSTASMGKFDKLNKYEAKPKLKANVNNREKNENKKNGISNGVNLNQESNKQKEILFQIFGKESKNAFNVNKASKSAKIRMEIKRSRKKKRR